MINKTSKTERPLSKIKSNKFFERSAERQNLWSVRLHFCVWLCEIMEFFNSAVGVLQTLVIALGAGLGIWGAINLLEGYGNDNPGANAHVR